MALKPESWFQCTTGWRWSTFLIEFVLHIVLDSVHACFCLVEIFLGVPVMYKHRSLNTKI